jgi:hypothetical protein
VHVLSRGIDQVHTFTYGASVPEHISKKGLPLKEKYSAQCSDKGRNKAIGHELL